MNLSVLLVLFSGFFLDGSVRVQQVPVSDSTTRRHAQHPPMLSTVVDGEAMPWMVIPEVEIVRRRVFKSPEDKARYMRLRYNVIKVLPYAKYAQRRYQQLYRDLALTGNKREQRRLVKDCEREIKDMFNREVKNMTVSQGAILIKLIDRQTGNSSYEVVRELRGGITAFFYQSIARVFGHNLKNEYDVEEDFEIENIIRSLERPAYPYF